jgi:glyoxylase-like metal-dependent hydrolase (beta-lactamase superfamily II)
MNIAMMVWLVRGGGRNILVDAGFYHERFFKLRKIRNYVKPSEVINRLGLKAEDITDIVVTHIHWDHIDGIDLFPKARIWIQRDEYSYYTGDAWQPQGQHARLDTDDILTLVQLNMAGRVLLVNGDSQEIIPGVTCYTGARHTWASQYVGVNTAQGIVVLASDNVYLYENLDKHVPIRATLDAGANLRAQDRMRQLAINPRFIVPGHDPAVFSRFSNFGEGVAAIK